MKLLSALYFLLSALPLAAQPFADVTFAQPLETASAAACSTSATNRISDTTTEATLLGFFSANTNATFFIPASDFTGCKVSFAVTNVGSPSFDLNCAVMSDSGGSPGSVLQVSGDTLAASSISGGVITFTFPSQAFVNGTKYWFTIKPSAAGDGSNHSVWLAMGGFTSGAIKAWTGASWDEVNNRLGKIEVFK